MYLDGFVLPVPAERMDEYRALASLAGQVWMDHGALTYVEAMADDMPDLGPGTRGWADALALKTGELPVFAFITYRDRAHRDQVNAAFMADPRIANGPGPDEMPNDWRRMLYAGFRPLVMLGAAP
jgi:uncharacterized protein YbaA (DUF1428 family)